MNDLYSEEEIDQFAHEIQKFVFFYEMIAIDGIELLQEFHAHLNGSIRESTIKELCKQNEDNLGLYEKAKELINSNRSLKEYEL